MGAQLALPDPQAVEKRHDPDLAQDAYEDCAGTN